jgi:hypothetical protein
MTWRRVLVAGLVAWLIALFLLLQPRQHAPPPIEHAHLLDPTVGPLPTLAPFGH